jgi:hypothetical protein
MVRDGITLRAFPQADAASIAIAAQPALRLEPEKTRLAIARIGQN